MKTSTLLLSGGIAIAMQMSAIFAATQYDILLAADGQSRDWHDTDNTPWNRVGLPTSEDTVYIRRDATVTVSSGNSAYAGALNVGVSSSPLTYKNGTLVVDGGSLTAAATIVGGSALTDGVQYTGTMTVRGASANVSLTSLTVGNGSSSNYNKGLLNLEGGLLKVSGDTVFGAMRATAEVKISGGNFHASGNVNLSSNGASLSKASLIMTGGELNVDSGKKLYIGTGSTASQALDGSMTVSRGKIRADMEIGVSGSSSGVGGRLNIGPEADIVGDLTLGVRGSLAFQVGGANFQTIDLSANTVSFDPASLLILDLSQMSWRGIVGADSLELSLFDVGSNAKSSNFSYTGYDTSDFDAMLDWDGNILKAYITDKNPLAVPEPSTYALIMAFGVLAVVIRRKRR